MQGHMKRGILYLQMKYFEFALDDFTKITEKDENNSKAFFYKGKALKKLSKNAEIRNP